MSTDTKIEWADKTWGVVLGCKKVGDGPLSGCANCYAIRTVHRLAHNPNPKIGPLYQGLTREEDGELDWTGVVRTVPERLTDPLKWRNPARVFVNSQSDLYHPAVPVEFLTRVLAVMAVTPRHTYQVLTKRPAVMRKVMADPSLHGAVDHLAAGIAHDNDLPYPEDAPWPLPNLHLGVSVETQECANDRIPILLDTPAAVRWISAEPLLGPIDLDFLGGVSALSRDWAGSAAGGTGCPHPLLDWVVVGCESGPDARPMDLAWAERIVKDCRYAGTPVLVKQLGTGPRGKATQDIDTFPPSLRVRQYPEVGCPSRVRGWAQ